MDLHYRLVMKLASTADVVAIVLREGAAIAKNEQETFDIVLQAGYWLRGAAAEM